MADVTTTTVIDEFMQAADAAEARDALGIVGLEAGGTFTAEVGFAQPDTLGGGVIARIIPRAPEGGKAPNLPFNFTCNQTDNAPNLTNNFVVGMGHNQDAGGGRESTDDCSIGILIEQRYDAGDLEAGGHPYAELHFAFTACNTSVNGVAAGTQLRLRSYTIDKEVNSVDMYDTASNYYIKLPNHSKFQTDYGTEADAIWFAMQPGELVMKNGVHGTEQNTFTISLSHEASGDFSRATLIDDIIRLSASQAVEILSPRMQVLGTFDLSGGDATFANGARLISQDTTDLAIYLSGGGSGMTTGMWRTTLAFQAYSHAKPDCGPESFLLWGKDISGVSFPHFTVGNVEYRASMQVSPPASASADGVAGTWAFDANYVYFCVATNTWRRTAHATW